MPGANSELILKRRSEFHVDLEPPALAGGSRGRDDQVVSRGARNIHRFT